jgi:atypical dual specificity phosphatase
MKRIIFEVSNSQTAFNPNVILEDKDHKDANTNEFSDFIVRDYSLSTRNIVSENENKTTEYCPLTSNDTEKLESWKNYSKYGDFIEGTYILPCKTFLEEKKWKQNLKTNEIFSIEDLSTHLSSKGLKLSYIIDLNRSYDYYNFSELQSQNPGLSEIKHRKFPLENAAIPEENTLSEIINILNIAHDKKQVVAIHCFHGVNRTGYVLCEFLCRKFRIDGATAIDWFEKARQIKIEHENLTEAIKKRWPSSN